MIDERTIRKYMKAGARMRLFKTLAGRLYCDMSELISAEEQVALLRALQSIDRISQWAGEDLLLQHPELPDEYRAAFSGRTDGEPESEVDKEVIQMAREAADECFKRAGY